MMNKEKLMENWSNLTDETKTQILELADKEIKEDYFVPKEGEIYYIYDYDYKVVSLKMPFCNSSFDKLYIAIGNFFRTPEEATVAGKCDYYTKRFETYVNRHSEKLDWTDTNQEKIYAYIRYDDFCANGCLMFNFDYNCKTQGTTYASSKQVLNDAIADIGEENFLKYVLKVEK